MAWTILEVVEAAFAYGAKDDYLDAAARGESAWDVFTTYDIVAIPLTIIAIAAYVVVCLWLYQVRSYLDVRRPDAHHARRKGWVWAGWLVPVVNLWFPFQIVRDIVKALGTSAGMLLGWWWTFWLFSLFTMQIGSRLVATDEVNNEAVSQLGNVEATNAVFTGTALVFWLMIIRRTVSAQDATDPA